MIAYQMVMRLRVFRSTCGCIETKMDELAQQLEDEQR